MSRKINEIVDDVTKVLSEIVAPHSPITKGDFVHYLSPENGEWHVNYIVGDEAFISSPDGNKKNVKTSDLEFAEKKIEDDDFVGMPMENSVDIFDDEIEAMPLDQLKDMPAMDKGMLGMDMDAITGDVDAEIDPSIYDQSIEKNPDQAGNYVDDETQDAGYPFPSFQGGLREFAGLDVNYILKESVEDKLISENAHYHIDNNIPLSENIFRYGSKGYGEIWEEFRNLWENDKVSINNEVDKWLMENSDLGKKGVFEGRQVPLDMPMLEAEYKGKKVSLNKPKRGGSKKFYVYVKGDNGNVKKVSFGAKSGGQSLAVKIKDPEARKNFSSRHNCDTKKDKTKAGYWSCNLPRYAKTLGMGSNMNTYW